MIKTIFGQFIEMTRRAPISTWRIISILLDPESDHLQLFEKQASRGCTIGNIYSSCQKRAQELLPRLDPSESNPPLDCQPLEMEEGEAIASGDPAISEKLIGKEIVHLSKWLGMGLPIEDKIFKTYNHFPVIYLY
jgi:hypothetical protein